jgi:UDP-3-O-[3-hydroxymyristoyl] glucosamine N-acyltransferase
VPNPKLAFARLVANFHPDVHPRPGIDPRAAIGANVSLGRDVVVSAFASVGDGSAIGDGSVLYPGVRVGERCRIGRNSVLYPNVVLYRETVIGDQVILHAGVVIGADGFGYVPDETGRHFKINQTGRVVIEDCVEIGANSCIDRAAAGTTLIKEGVKIDNLVQIAHNCTVGEHSIIVAQAGVAGSCMLGRRVVLGGQVGVADHVTLGDNVMLAAQAGTFRDIASNQIHGGSPSVPLTDWKKYVALLPDFPVFVRKLRDLEKRVEAIENPPTGD